MSDKELDDLFRGASGKTDAPFEASDWQKMETLLDSKGGVRSAFWNWKSYTLATILLLLGTTTAVMLLNTNKEESLSLHKEHVVSPDKSSAMETDTKNNAEPITSSLVEKKTRPAEQKEYIAQSVAVDDAIGLKLKKQHLMEDKPDLLKSGGNDIKEVPAPSSKEGMTTLVENGSEIVARPTDENKSSSSDSTIAVKPNDELNAKDSIEENVSDKSSINPHSFSLKATLSPDYSSVGYFTPGETGFNYGLLAEYGLGEHFSVSAGAIWSKKLYSSESSGYSAYGQIADSKTITGDCRILDVPLLINYYFNPGQRFTVYGSAGLSSYIMFKEVYDFEVIKNGKSYDYTTSVEGKNNEWFKMANISIGLQYRLTNQWALQGEPFVKIPLAGIGEGNIKLVSSGLFFNIKYTFK